MDEVEVKSYVSVVCKEFEKELDENRSLIEFMALAVLKFEGFDVELAVKRLRSYLDWRRKLFGNLAEHSLEGDVLLRKQIQSCFVQFNSSKCPGGEVLISIQLSRHNPNRFNAEQTVKCCHYMILSALKADTTLCCTGCVVVLNVSDIGLENVDLQVPTLIASVINCMPLRLVKGIIYDPPFPIRMVMPIVMAIVPDNLREKIHVVTSAEELSEANSGIAPLLPVSLGGSWNGYTPYSHLEHYRSMNYTA